MTRRPVPTGPRQIIAAALDDWWLTADPSRPPDTTTAADQVEMYLMSSGYQITPPGAATVTTTPAGDQQQPATPAHGPEACPAETAWVVEAWWRGGGWRTHFPARAERDRAQREYDQAVAEDAGYPYRLVRKTTTFAVETEHTPVKGA
ncbi:hypothetical protein [Streptomyces sp. NPDC088789]|uniref:hypothetical protein n=1 Tax=Streptomyces sp. NPDC088789 TaxID=3365899 RepID=UPI0038135A6E